MKLSSIALGTVAAVAMLSGADANCGYHTFKALVAKAEYRGYSLPRRSCMEQVFGRSCIECGDSFICYTQKGKELAPGIPECGGDFRQRLRGEKRVHRMEDEDDDLGFSAGDGRRNPYDSFSNPRNPITYLNLKQRGDEDDELGFSAGDGRRNPYDSFSNPPNPIKYLNLKQRRDEDDDLGSIGRYKTAKTKCRPQRENYEYTRRVQVRVKGELIWKCQHGYKENYCDWVDGEDLGELQCTRKKRLHENVPYSEWKVASNTKFESYPTNAKECKKFNGCEYLGKFAGFKGKLTKSEVPKRNIVAFFDNNHQSRWDGNMPWWNKFVKGKVLEVRRADGKGEPMRIDILDTCANKDCKGCCSKNANKQTGILLDFEVHTAKRFWGDDYKAKGGKGNKEVLYRWISK